LTINGNYREADVVKLAKVAKVFFRVSAAALQSSSAFLFVCPTIAYAQMPQDDTATVSETKEDAQGQSEIVVTAQKREQRLLDVPASVTALNATSLATANQIRLRDFFVSVPGFQVSPSPGGGSQQTLAIRGVSSGAYANPTVGIMIDDVPFGASTYDFSPDVNPSDLQRVEVLRGPQGTLYGANSMGGLLKFVTIEPSMAGASSRVETGLNSITHGEGVGYAFRGGINLPLSSTLAVRVSGFARKDPGYIDNPVTGQTDVNDIQSSGGLASALWQPSETLSIKLSALYQRTKADGSSEEVRGVGLTEYQQNYILSTGQSTSTSQAYSAVIKAELGGINFTSATAYSRFKKTAVQDFSDLPPWGASAALVFGVPGAPSSFDAGVKRITQETRATFKTGEILDWLVGGFFSDEDAPINQRISGQSTAGTNVGDLITFEIPYKYREFAVFVNPTLNLSDRFSIQFGGRYSWTRAIFDEVTFGGAFYPTPFSFPAITHKDRIFTFLVTPQFKVSRDLMIYGRVATGYRPGGSNSFNTDPTVPRAAEADTTTNYELGVKADVLSNMLSFDASLYYIDWKKLQITLVSPSNGLGYTANAARAKSEGAEISATLRPGDGLTIGGWVSYNNAVLTEGVVNTATFAPTGARLPFNTKFTANISVDKIFEISDDLSVTLGATFGHVGERNGTFIATPARAFYPAFNKIDLRIGLDYDSWSVDIYANNIGDSRGVLGGGPGSFPESAYSYIQPRSLGASISKKF
jgi:iron complex outermembrane recepter protein